MHNSGSGAKKCFRWRFWYSQSTKDLWDIAGYKAPYILVDGEKKCVTHATTYFGDESYTGDLYTLCTSSNIYDLFLQSDTNYKPFIYGDFSP